MSAKEMSGAMSSPNRGDFGPGDPADEPDFAQLNDASLGVRAMQLAVSLDDLLEDATVRPTILIVDELDLNRRLLRGILKAADYRILEATRASAAFAILESEKIDLIVVDLVMPGLSGPDFCRRVKSNRRTHLIPILIVTSVQGVESEVAGISSGADEFLTKPLHPTVVRVRIRSLLRSKAVTDSLEEAESILFSLAQSVEQRDRCTGQHCRRLASYSVALGNALGLPRGELLALHRGGYLHDIGKIGIPDSILFKKGFLDDQEWLVMRSHTIKGEDICKPMKTLAPVLPIIRNHHERFDGSGYPDGLAGEDIPLLARILQVADIYDALTTERPYKSALTHTEALRVMEEESERGWRDPELIPVFAEIATGAGSDLASLQRGNTMQRSLLKMGRAVEG
jgi:putative two-component system response regulator